MQRTLAGGVVGLGSSLATIRADVRSGARLLRRSPGFASAAVLTFALGIGANTAIFSIVDAAILRPLPYPDSERLVAITQHNPQSGRRSTGIMPRDFLDWRERRDVFEQIVMIAGGAFTLLGSGEPEELRVTRTTAGFFEMLGTPPLLGRLFTRDDEQPGHGRRVVISHAFWKARFGLSPRVLGTTVHLNGEPYEIVGVLPPEFSYPPGSRSPTPVFLPLTITERDRQDGVLQSMGYSPTARLRDGIGVVEAEAALSQRQAAADARKQAFNKGYTRVELVPLIETYVGRARSWMLMLLGVVGLVLLIACANVASLIVAHGTVRERELTIRSALGASRGRIARQLLAESLVLAIAGAAAGVALAWWGIALLRAALPPGIPRAANIGLDLRVLGFTSALAVATGIAAGILPAIQGSRVDLVGGLKEASGTTSVTGRQRVRQALVWVEVVLAVMLLVGAGLFISSFARLVRIDPGFDPDGLIALNYASPRVPPGQKPDLTYLPRMLESVRQVPAVQAALITAGNAPFEGGYTSVPLRVYGRAEPSGDSDRNVRLKRVSTGFLEVLRVPVRRGRGFTSQDTRDSQPVAIVTESAARERWPGLDPIGDRIQIDKVWFEIVGIARDLRYGDPVSAPVPEVLVPYEQLTVHSGGWLLIRAQGDPRAVAAAVKAAIWVVNPAQAITDVRTAEELFGRATAARRFNMLLMSLFALLALVIAATGIYGVIAFVVHRRTREIGVRMALGARSSQVVALFLRQGLVVLATGAAAGLLCAWLLARAVQSFLFEVQPRDPVVFTAAAVTLGLTGIAACWIPARRAARVDPLSALRTE